MSEQLAELKKGGSGGSSIPDAYYAYSNNRGQNGSGQIVLGQQISFPTYQSGQCICNIHGLNATTMQFTTYNFYSLIGIAKDGTYSVLSKGTSNVSDYEIIAIGIRDDAGNTNTIIFN